MGRQVQEIYGKEKQCVLTMPVLPGLDGVNRMSKSLGNYIGIDESAKDIFGKTLSIPDNLIYQYFELVTDINQDELENKRSFIEKDPRNAKRELAKKLVSMYHNQEASKQAEEEFDRIFINKGLPDDISELKIEKSDIGILDLIMLANFAQSKSEARRLVRGNGVSYNDVKITDENVTVAIENDAILKVGKKKFIKTIL